MAKRMKKQEGEEATPAPAETQDAATAGKSRRARAKGGAAGQGTRTANRQTPEALTEAPQRRRGRPKGSKNRPKVAEAGATTTRGRRRSAGSVAAASPTRGRRGRPPKTAAAATIGDRLSSMIRELDALRSEIVQLESRAQRIEELRSLFQ